MPFTFPGPPGSQDRPFAATVDRCPVCWLPAPAGGQTWRLVSRHATSLGDVEYCTTAPCGCLVVLLDGRMLKSRPGGGTTS